MDGRTVKTLLAFGIGLAVASPLHAEVVRITISSRAPVFNGQSFGAVGPYEDIRGIAFGEIDPRDPKNAVITDIELAPRNVRGMVEYRTTFTLRKPVDMTRSAGVLLYNIVNRGNHNGPNTWHVGGDPGDGFLYRLGHAVLWSGWQGDMPIASVSAVQEGIDVPVAKHADGSALTGRVWARFVSVAGGVNTHAAARRRGPDASHARHRERDDGLGCVRNAGGRKERSGCDRQLRLGVRRLPDGAVSRHTRSHAHLSQEQVRSRAPLRARLHRQGSLRARRRHGGDARRRLVLPLRGGGLCRHGQSDRRRRAARRRDGQLAVGPLREGVRQSWLQPGRARTHRVGRAQRADRRHARQLQHALRAAGRHRRAVRPGCRGSTLVGRLPRSRARPARVGPAPSLHRDEDLPEDH